jgi:hypothetical protein
MLPLLIGAGIGAGTGLLKHYLVDKPAHAKQEKQRMAMNAAIAQYSPWTGLRPDLSQSEEPSAIGSMLGMGGLGAQQGMAVGNYMQQQEMYPELAKFLQSRGAAQTTGPTLFQPSSVGDFNPAPPMV